MGLIVHCRTTTVVHFTTVGHHNSIETMSSFFKENWDEGDEKNEDLESEESELENESETFDEEG